MNLRRQFALATLVLVTLVMQSVAAKAEDEAAARQKERNELLGSMRMRAKATNVLQVVGDKRVRRNPAPQPLIRFSDQPRDILDATLWAFGTPGRPVALQKIEVYQRPEGRSWFYCMTSLSESLIETNWRDGESWSSKQPGTKFRVLPRGPTPANSDAARLTQMKQIARRFDCNLYDEPSMQRSALRALKTPLYRYADPTQGIRDGVIFGFTTGTNPDALLSIELHDVGNSAPTWKYGLARITLCQVTVKLDDVQVWSVPYVHPQGPGNPSKFDTWLFFHEAAVAE